MVLSFVNHFFNFCWPRRPGPTRHGGVFVLWIFFYLNNFLMFLFIFLNPSLTLPNWKHFLFSAISCANTNYYFVVFVVSTVYTFYERVFYTCSDVNVHINEGMTMTRRHDDSFPRTFTGFRVVCFLHVAYTSINTAVPLSLCPFTFTPTAVSSSLTCSANQMSQVEVTIDPD